MLDFRCTVLMAALLLMGCEKAAVDSVANAETLILGEWEFSKFKAKSWRGRVRVGGERIKVIELTLIVDSSEYRMTDDLGDAVESGTYSISEDSIILFDADAAPTRFGISKLTNSELELLDVQINQTRIGEVYSEGVFSYER